MTLLRVAKLEAAGNDFLIVLDWEARTGPSPSRARYLCDRRNGLGADGVLSVLPPRAGGDVRMELVNADGSAAEMSGNGIRCLTLAVLDWGIAAGPTLIIETTAGLRRVSAKDPGAAGAEVQLVAEMGTVGVGREVTSPLAGTRACLATVGNPHLVIAGDAVGDADISSIGPALERSQPGGVNVELVAVGPASGELRLGVWERGVGATKACGTGSCASAAVAHSWGLVTEKVSVRNPGGVLQVKLSGDDLAAPRALLGGPVRRVARFEVDRS